MLLTALPVILAPEYVGTPLATNVVPVRAKSSHVELHKQRLMSGARIHSVHEAFAANSAAPSAAKNSGATKITTTHQ